MTEARTGLRVKVLALLVVFMFLALTTRLWFLQVMASERFRSQASENAVRLVDIPAARGRILDANGVPIVDNQPSLQVVADREKVAGHEEQVLFDLSNLLTRPGKPVTVPMLTKRLESNKYPPYAPVPLAFNVPKEVAFAIGEYPDRFPGVTVEQVPSRQYPLGDLASHLLGYIGPITAQEAASPTYASYSPNDTVGQAGLEQQYESYLRGQKGATKLRVNAAGQVLDEIGTIQPPVPGDDIRLNLDANIQRIAEESLKLGMSKAQAAGYRAPGGAVVILEPSTGAVKALVSAPGYDPSIFNGGLTSEEAASLGYPNAKPNGHGSLYHEWRVAKQLQPTFDRALQGEYPPGSTIKPFVALSALSEPSFNVTENTAIPCPGSFEVPGDTSHTKWNNWYPGDLGSMNLSQAIVQSCDTVFYWLGYWKYWQAYCKGTCIPPIGYQPKELLQKDLEKFGFGQHTGIDFPSGSPGLVPDQAWKQASYRHTGSACNWNWCPGDYINMAIGQGNLKVTPLQLADAFGVIANNGKLCAPRLAADAEQAGRIVKRFPPNCHQVPSFSTQQYQYVRHALEGVPRPGGTAASAFTGFPFGALKYFGGKTGTAQVTGKQDYSWFGCIVKGTDKKGQTHEYVIVAMVEQGGHGSETAAPVARQIVDGLFGLEGHHTLTIAGVAD